LRRRAVGRGGGYIDGLGGGERAGWSLRGGSGGRSGAVEEEGREEA